ncbi:MAG: hypothetical protein KDN18_00560 [Verrucomicrobiae bacterium]|nr:hypothetical protein [Verrucomicrobiae bacterium]
MYSLQPLRFSLVPLALLSMLGEGCSGKAPESVAGATETMMEEWPEFERFEALFHEVSGLIETGRHAEVLMHRSRLLEAAWAVNLRTLPTGANKGETLRQLLGDLVSKVNCLAVPSIDETVVSEVISSMKPIVAEINRASGSRKSG